MKVRIRKVVRLRRRWTINVPVALIEELGWENVSYVSFNRMFGDRIVIEKVAIDGESKEKDN